MKGLSDWLNNSFRRARRLFKNRCCDAKDVQRVLSPDALDRLTARIKASEQNHGGEIRICIEAGLPWRFIRYDASTRERALSLFSLLRIWDTQQNNGVLIYLLLAEHAIEIIADRGLCKQVSTALWSDITQQLSRLLHEQQFEQGLGQAIDEINALLTRYFPESSAGASKINELPDEPVVLI